MYTSTSKKNDNVLVNFNDAESLNILLQEGKQDYINNGGKSVEQAYNDGLVFINNLGKNGI